MRRWVIGAVTAAVLLAGCAPPPPGDPARAPRQAAVARGEAAPGSSARAELDDVVAQHQALDWVVQSELATVPDVLSATEGLYSDLEIYGEYPGTLKLSYTYAEPVDREVSAAALEAGMKGMQKDLDDHGFPFMLESGVVEPRVVTSYYGPDGFQVWTHTYEPSQP